MQQIELDLSAERTKVQAEPSALRRSLEALTDEELVARFLETRCDFAFQTLYQRYAPSIYKFLVRRLNDPEKSRDLMQVVFIRIIKHLHEFDPAKASQGDPKVSAFAKWSHTIARRLLINEFRSISRNRQDCLTDMTPTLANRSGSAADRYYNAPSTQRTPDQLAYDIELDDALREAVDQMDPLLRDPFVLHTIKGEPLNVVAEALKIPVGTVKSRNHAAKKQIQTMLAHLNPSLDEAEALEA